MTVEAKKRPALTTWILTGVIVILAATLIGVLLFLKNQPQPERGVVPIREIEPLDPDSSHWGVNFPNQ